MCRLTSWTTESGSVVSDSRATAPTTACPSSKSTIDGVVGAPSAFGSTTGCPEVPTWATTDMVVPRSIPKAVRSATTHAPSDSLLVQPPDGGGDAGRGQQQQHYPRPEE